MARKPRTLTPPEPGETPATVEPDDARPHRQDLIAELAELAATADADGPPQPLIAGTFAMYPTPGGGLALVADLTISPNGAGEYRMHARPGMLRALTRVMKLVGKG